MPIRTALVVDDSRLARLTLTKLLEKRDIQVSQASSASEAMESLKGKRPDVIMMDVTMPDTDGFEATRQITGDPNTSKIPVVMCTAEDTSEARDRAHACGAHGFLTKPASEENITDVLHRLADELDASEPILADGGPDSVLSVDRRGAELDESEIEARVRATAEAVLREQGDELFSGLMTDVARKVFESMAPANDSRDAAPMPDDFAEQVRAQAVESATAAASDAARHVAREEVDAAARSSAAEAAQNATADIAERIGAELRAEFDSRIESLLGSDQFAERINRLIQAALEESRNNDEEIAELARREAADVARREASAIAATLQEGVDSSGIEALRVEARKAVDTAKRILVVSVALLAAAAATAFII